VIWESRAREKSAKVVLVKLDKSQRIANVLSFILGHAEKFYSDQNEMIRSALAIAQNVVDVEGGVGEFQAKQIINDMAVLAEEILLAIEASGWKAFKTEEFAYQ
jgi:hypothetical protein